MREGRHRKETNYLKETRQMKRKEETELQMFQSYFKSDAMPGGS